MEEQKNKETKMGVVSNQDNQDATQEKMPTFEELYKAYMDLANKHQVAIQKLQQADRYIQTFNRLDYLFKVVEISVKDTNWHFEDEFISNCIKEIQDMMTIPEETQTAKQEN